MNNNLDEIKMNADDLLSFKEYSPVHDTHNSGGSAEININSPNRQQQSPYQNATTTSNHSTTNDPLQDLLSSMSASVNVLQSDDRQRSTSSKILQKISLNLCIHLQMGVILIRFRSTFR